MKSCRLFIILLLTALLAQSADCAEQSLPRAHFTDGSTYKAKQIRLDKDVVQLHGEKDVRSLRLNDLVVWGAPVEVRRGSYLLLTDGSVLAGEVTEIKPDDVQFHSVRRPGLWRSNSLLRERVRGVVYQASADPHERDRWEAEFFDGNAKHDRLLLVGGDVLSGTLLQTTSDETSDEAKTSFRLLPTGSKTPLEVPQQRVLAVAFAAREAADTSKGRFRLGLADGSMVLASSIAAKGDRLRVTLADGQTLEAQAEVNDLEPPESFWDRVVFLQPLLNSVIYLSDLRTLGFKQVPLFDWQQEFAVDRNVTGSKLRVNGQRYLKGLGMPATSRLAYEIPEGAKRFEAKVAIDDAAQGEGSVIFRVFLEAEGGKWNAATESKIVRGGDSPATLSTPVRGAKRLALVVDMADRGDVRDYADWLNARFLK